MIVDEISMMGPETCDSFIQRLNRVSKTAKAQRVRCLLFGDFAQYLNVVSYKDKKFMLEKYGTTKLLDSKQFKKLKLEVFELDQNKRVGDDKEFIERLEDVRHGKNIEECLKYFNKRVGTPDPEAVFITTTNAKVDEINKQVFDTNPNPVMYYPATISGDFKIKDSRLAENLALKESLRVMSLVNDPSGEDLYVNGSIGTITYLMDSSVEVAFDNGNTVWIEPTEEENKEYYTDEEGELCWKIVGRCSGIGLRQSSAITGNKAQGIGVDRATVDLGDGAFAAGQCYVMLSRLTNIEGLTLTRPLVASDIIVDESVRKFYTELRGEKYESLASVGYEQYKIRLIVAGGRDFNNYSYMKQALDHMLQRYSKKEVLIVSGKAKGADSLGEVYAESKGIAVKEFPANWKDITTPPVKIRKNNYGEYNVLAGIVRNKKMGDFATHAVIFHDGVSTGSKQMIEYMNELNKPVKVFKY